MNGMRIPLVFHSEYGRCFEKVLKYLMIVFVEMHDCASLRFFHSLRLYVVFPGRCGSVFWSLSVAEVHQPSDSRSAVPFYFILWVRCRDGARSV